MKVLLLRADDLRHRSLASILHASGFLAAEIIETKYSPYNINQSELIGQHFEARQQSELDFFGCNSIYKSNFPSLNIKNGKLNSTSVIKFIRRQKFDISITFGVSILNGELIQELRNNVLGIHLGLSPYYRGSATNFFPFVNSELGAVGYTFMHLNSGLDKGPIIHQGRAPIILGDSIHTIGNRNISKMFEDILRLIENHVDLKVSSNNNYSNGRLYSRKDFTEENLKKALKNLASGLIPKYLANIKNSQEKFPIIQYKFQRVI